MRIDRLKDKIMNLLFLTIAEMPDLEENAMYPDLLRYFRDQGHKVFVICPLEKRRGLSTQEKYEQGIRVLRVRTGNITKTGLLEKGFATLLVGLQFQRAFQKYFRNIKFDLLLYTTPPISLTGIIRHIKKKNQAFTYLMLKDIFPQNALDIGILSRKGLKGLIFRYFRSLEKKLYRLSDGIGCMSEANVNYLIKHHPYLKKQRISVCPNTINPAPDAGTDRKISRSRFGLAEDKLIFICGGNFGKPQGIDFILEVLQRNEEKSDRHFVLCGAGTEYGRLLSYAGNKKHITVLAHLGREEYNSLLDSADVGLIFLDYRFTIPNFPSRILDYMNHSLPVLAATDRNTDLGQKIRDNGFGWWCESRDPQDYQHLLDSICAAPSAAEEMGRNSRRYLLEQYDTRSAYEAVMRAFHSKPEEGQKA